MIINNQPNFFAVNGVLKTNVANNAQPIAVNNTAESSSQAVVQNEDQGTLLVPTTGQILANNGVKINYTQPALVVETAAVEEEKPVLKDELKTDKNDELVKNGSEKTLTKNNRNLKWWQNALRFIDKYIGGFVGIFLPRMRDCIHRGAVWLEQTILDCQQRRQDRLASKS